jgi:ATP-dependent Clp protease protease subunit
MQKFKKGRATSGSRVWFEVQSEPAEVFIYDEIGAGFMGGGVPAEDFIRGVKAIGLGPDDSLTVRLNSPGGSLFDGFSIYNYLASAKYRVNVRIDGVAASAASLIAMAGTLTMPENTFLFIHAPWMLVAGNAEDMRKAASDLDKMKESAVGTYLRKTGDRVSRADLIKMLDDETWLSAEKAVTLGFADTVDKPVRAAAFLDFDLSMWRNLPSALSKQRIEDQSEEDMWREIEQQEVAEQRREIVERRAILQTLK